MKTGKWLMFMLIPLVLGVNFSPLLRGMAGYSPEIDPETEKSILNATVQIYKYSLMRNGALANAGDTRFTLGEAQQYIEDGRGYYMVHGLGTVVVTGDGALVVTHDHWGEEFESADVVEFRDASGRILQTITGLEFKMSILYHDSGTLVLVAPAGINLTPANLGDSHQVPLEEIVLITRQKPDDKRIIEVIEAKVKSPKFLEGREAWVLDTLNGDAVIPGDSGGGVWLGGKLVGNVWARHIALTIGIGPLPAKEKATRTFYAAQNPVQIQPARAKNLLSDTSGTRLYGKPQENSAE